MVKFVIKLAVLGLMLITAFLKTVYSQEQKVYYELSKYSKWSFVAGPVIYDKAKLTPQYGDLTFKNKSMFSFNAFCKS